MGIINLLPENLINQIAAGEVVERPASVIKELMENSIDAGATEIIIDIEDGGRKLIRVADNGCGMSREDALLSLKRHATSKIREISDLFNISTLGFRGEALPSIASVSRLKLTTVPEESISGTSIGIDGGKEMEVKDFGGAVGAAVEVRDLFFNTPARLKFMKSATTELGHITETVTRMAVSYPSIRFLYSHNGFQVYNLPPTKDLLTRICLILKEDEKNLLKVSLNMGVGTVPIVVRGYVSGPEINRPTQRSIYIFVNGRYVRDRVVIHALMDAYRTIVERDRYPLAALFLSLPPADLDVNVHPAKSEVRFRNTDEIHRAVYAGVSEALKGWTEKKAVGAYRDTPLQQYQERVMEAVERYAASAEYGMGSAGYFSKSLSREPFVPSTGSGRMEQTPITLSLSKGEGFFSSLTILGRVGGTYIVCSDGKGLYLVDQHAAHERIAFERLKESYQSKRPESQALLIPVTVDLPSSEAVLLKDYIDTLSETGLEVEEFGRDTFVVKAVPPILAKRDINKLLKDVADELAYAGKTKGIDEVMDRIFSRMACHTAVEGGDFIDQREIKALLSALDSVDFSSNCPHGRPVFVVFSKNDIEKMFGRK